MAKMYVSDDVFCKEVVRAVKNGEGAAEVAAALGLKETTVKTRANALRKAKIPLPKFKSANQKTDLAVLAKMVSDYMAEAETETKEVTEATEVTEEVKTE